MLIWQLCISQSSQVACHGKPSFVGFKESVKLKCHLLKKKCYKQTKSEKKSNFMNFYLPPLLALGRTVGRVWHGRVIWPMRGRHGSFWPIRSQQCVTFLGSEICKGDLVSLSPTLNVNCDVIIMYKCWKCFIISLIIVRPQFLEQKSRAETWSA